MGNEMFHYYCGRNKFGILTLFFIICALYAGNPVSVPIDHPIYPFLDRIETSGVLDNLCDGVRPLDRESISNLLIMINEKRDQLSKIDRKKLDNFLLDFRYEIDSTQKYPLLPENRRFYSPLVSISQLKKDFMRCLKRKQPEEENHLFLWEDDGNSFYFDFIANFSYSKTNMKQNRLNQNQIYSFRGTINKNFGYSLQILLAQISGDKGYINKDQIVKTDWLQRRGDKQIYFDHSGGDIAYRSPYIDFRFAQQPVSWGVGESGQLILSDNVEQFPYVSFSKRWKWGSFTSIHGKLLADSIGINHEGQRIIPDKWIAANRLEISPWSRLAIALTDMIIYGNRPLEWAYLFPVNFYRPVEHTLRDRDNALLAVDLELRVLSGVKIYGTILLDELKQSELFSDWYGNKHGFQLGTHLEDPFGLANTGLCFEYLAIMPWVYTHKYDVNSYVNDGRSLGYWAGPNSEVIYLHITKDWHYRLKTGLKYVRWKHGANYENENIGGDIHKGHDELLGTQTIPRTTRKFLEGILRTEDRMNLYAQYELLNDLYLSGSVALIKTSEIDVKKEITEIQLGMKFDY
jgi:hypothetical protein